MTSRLFLLALLVLLKTNYFSFSQIGSDRIDDWLKKLGARNGPVFSGIDELLASLKGKDSSECAMVFDEVEKRGSTSNQYFAARFNLAKAVWLHDYPAGKSLNELTRKAVTAAYETDDDSLISAASWWCGLMMYYAGQMELASMDCLNAVEIDERIERKTTAGQYDLLSTVLYTTHDNEKCIYYARRAIEVETDTAYMTRHNIMNQLNTIGLCWKRIGNYDSAFFYFNRAMQVAVALPEKIWQSIISGNIGQIYYSQQRYALAKPLLESDYRYSKEYGELGSASNSLQWLARINLAQGKRDSALVQVKEALQLEQKNPSPNYLENIYYATADIYRAFRNNDSAYKYSQLYTHLHDSIERTVSDSRLEISRIRLDNVKNVLAIKNLNKERQAEKFKRNAILAAIILCAVIAILIINSRRVKSVHRQQLALQEKQAAESQIVAAREQLEMFRQNIVEKTNLIDRLQQQAQYNQATAEQSQIVTELSHQTILTEEDWDKFKLLFEKIHPGFFLKLKDRATGITTAEQRMAALTRLQLTSKQMASMLGISVDSVHKTRQRLRERLHLADSATLEELIAGI